MDISFRKLTTVCRPIKKSKRRVSVFARQFHGDVGHPKKQSGREQTSYKKKLDLRPGGQSREQHKKKKGPEFLLEGRGVRGVINTKLDFRNRPETLNRTL